MYLIPDKKWNLTGNEPEQSKLFFELWLEKVGFDSHFTYELPLHSCYQLLRNLQNIIPLVKQKTISPENITDIIEEILNRLEGNIWLNKFYPNEIQHIKTVLTEAKTSSLYKDITIQNKLELILEAFLNTLQKDNIQLKQLRAVCDLAQSKQTYTTIEKNIDEFLTDLIHAGHSKLYLHKWVVREIIEHQKDLLGQNSVEKLAGARFLGSISTKSYSVLLKTSANARIQSTGNIKFVENKEDIPEKFLTLNLPSVNSSTSRYVIVEVGNSLDVYAAFEEAVNILTRYLSSVRFQKLSFTSPEISSSGIVLDLSSDTAIQIENVPKLISRSIFSADKFYSIEAKSGKNQKTFDAIDKVLYWFEIAQKSPAELKFISLWTALEFLFSVPGYKTIDGIVSYLPPYFGLAYARSVLKDFDRHVEFANIISPGKISSDLMKYCSNKDKRMHPDYTKMLSTCCDDETIADSLSIHPILKRKFYKVRRLNPSFKTGNRFTLLSDLDSIECDLILDVKRFYRTRNMLVHGAEIQDRNLDRILKRMEYMMSFIIDKLADAYYYNPNHSLTALHEVFYSSYQFYKKRIDEGKTDFGGTVFPRLLYSKH